MVEERSREPETVHCSTVELVTSLLRPASREGSVEFDSRESRYGDEGRIGRGGMGGVHRVLDRVMLRRSAMKILDQAQRGDSRQVLRFLEEAQITGQLDHPNIVPVYDIGVAADGLPAFFTMKLVEGETLAKLVADAGDKLLAGARLERMLQVLLKVCDAVSFAHSRGVIHRDLKPSNVMVGTHGQVYVMDWGLAVLRGDRASSEETPISVSSAAVEIAENGASRQAPIAGTPAYMAPEQAHGHVERIDARTDVYGLGGILYHVLTGTHPRPPTSLVDTLLRARRGEVTPFEEAAATRNLPPGLCRIALKALAPIPAQRHQSVEALKSELESFLRGGGWFAARRFAAGSAIVVQGDPPDAAYIIIEGRCRVVKSVGDRVDTLRELGPGDVFGETAIVTEQPRSASVIAVDDVEVAVVTRESLEQELERSVWLGAVVKALAERFRDLDARLSRQVEPGG
jgi:eukaryotic-like serine/threonine-protein kinase